MNFANCLEQLMRHNDITVKELAEKSDITETSICHYKSGYRQPSVAKATKLLNALGYELEIRKVSKDDK